MLLFRNQVYEESPNVTQGMLHALVWSLAQFPQTPSSVQSSQDPCLQERSLIIIIDHYHDRVIIPNNIGGGITGGGIATVSA